MPAGSQMNRHANQGNEPQAWSADLRVGAFGTRDTAPSWSSALRFMGRPHAFFVAHWDHEPDWSAGLRPGVVLRLGRSADSRVYQYLPKSSQPAKIFLTTDGHGLTRMKTGFLLSVSIRVHPWLEHIGCGFAALRCYPVFCCLSGAVRTTSWEMS